MSKTNNIERNKLDYLLTDIMPVELTELFSFNNFYEYILSKQKDINLIIKKLQKAKGENKKILFKEGWSTAPLKYSILKGNNSSRELNLVQPFSALNIYFFIECYQKEILNLLSEKAVFSLRYHKKNNELYYKKKIKKITQYFETTSEKVNKGVIQQTGTYYKIHKYNSVASFTNSRLWQQCNFKFGYFAKVDYKSCFDSIYSHSYKWIIEKNVVESKNAANSNLFMTIDRLLQNINARSSNGLIVGPEFSRMIAELLLQEIDYEVKIKLATLNKEYGSSYSVFRYVDDAYIFANSPQDIDLIIQTFKEVAHKYLLQLNDLKLLKCTTPFMLNSWLSKTRILANDIASLFYTINELANVDDKYLLKDGHIPVDRIKDEFHSLVCEFPGEIRYIVSFLLSTLLNNISRKKNGINLFKSGATGRAFILLDLALYFYSFCACFEHTQRIISMIVYMNDELDFIDNYKNHEKLQKLWNWYAFIFENGNLNDLCNLFLLFSEYKLVLDSKREVTIEKKLQKLNNPLLWSNYLIYSRYEKKYFDFILAELEKIIKRELNKITKEEEMLQTEFWYIIVFNNCPYISVFIRAEMEDIIRRLKKPNPTYPNHIITNMICDFMLINQENQFFSWGYYKFSTSKQITYRTYQRTMFKQYRNKKSFDLYGSLD